jgi:hypothetical protein
MSTLERKVPQRAGGPPPGGLLLTWAWLVLLAIPLSFAVGFVASYLPFALTGWSETDPQPLWFRLLVAVIGIGVTWTPVAVSAVLARRVVRGGRRAGWAPLALDGVLTVAAAWWVVISV